MECQGLEHRRRDQTRRDTLSSSSHFPLNSYSRLMKPVMLPPGRARLSTKPLADRIGDTDEHDGSGAGRPPQGRHGEANPGQDDVRW